MSQKIVIWACVGLTVAVLAVFGGIKFQDRLLKNELTENIKSVQQNLNAYWANIDIEDNNVLITGQTVDNENHKLLISQLTKVQGVNTVTSKVKISRPLTMEQCQQKVDSLLAENEVQFAKQNSQIDSASHELLRQIANSLWLCPDARLLIVAHTSNENNVDENIQVSESRSSALLNYFNNNLGFNNRSIAAVGMGAAFPIAQNNSDENRSLNERIEIKIR